VDCIGQPHQKKHKQSVLEFAMTAAQLMQLYRNFMMRVIKAERIFVDTDCSYLK